MPTFAQQFNDALFKAMSRSEAASLAGKASAAARKAKAGGGGESFDDASKKANALIAANPGKYGAKGAKGKAKGKAGAKGAKPKAAKDPAAAKAKADKEAASAAEHAQAHAEHEQDRAQRQSDRTQHQTEHAQSLKEHEQDRAAKQVAQAKRDKQQAQKQKASAKAKAAPKADKPAAAPKVSTPVAPPAVSAAAATLASGTNITPGQRDQLVQTGLARQSKDGSLVLTSTGLKAAQQSTQKLAKANIARIFNETGMAKAINSIEQQRAVFAGMGSSGKAWPRGKDGKRSPHAGPKSNTSTGVHQGGEGKAHPSANEGGVVTPVKGTVTTTIVHDARPQGQRPALSAPISGDMDAHARFVEQQTQMKAIKQQQRQLKTKLKAVNTKLGVKKVDAPAFTKAFAPTGTAWHGWAAITKVDEAQRMVYGDASTETPDAQPGIWKGETYAGDIIAMDAIAAALPDYMQWANLREMHGPVAAGVVKDASVEGSRFPIAAHVTDDQAWYKVTTGTYKGFSIGGKCEDAEIVKIAGMPYRRITKLSLTEISLVDRPANPQARITLYKGADMAETDDTATEVADETKITKAADPTKAIALLQQLRNDAETDGDMDAADEYTAAIRSVAQAAGIATATTDDTDAEPDADDTGMALDDGSDPSTDMAMAIKTGDLAKADDLRKAFPNYSDEGLIDLLLKRGQAISGNNMGHLKNAHDSLQKATGGAVCAPGQQEQGTGIAMAASLAPDDLAKAFAPVFAGLVGLLEKNDVKTDAITKRLDHLEKQEAPGAPATRAVPIEKALPGVPEPTPTPNTEEAELNALRKLRDGTTDETVRRALYQEVSQRELRKVYTPQ